MTKGIIISVSLLVLAIAVYVGKQWFPKSNDMELPGIQYQLGKGNETVSKPVVIRLEGKMKRSLLGRQHFEGRIEVSSEELSVPKHSRTLRLVFDDLRAIIDYRYFSDGQLGSYPYGTIYIDKDMNKFTILRFSEETASYKGEKNVGWSGENGIVISAPAATREEAVKLSNEITYPLFKRNFFE